MSPEEIHKLLGGYATNALSADERKTLFEAALNDQELFNALQNEDALRELLADPVARDQIRRQLGAPSENKRRPQLWSRRWVFGVVIPAVVAVILIVVMNRANAPRLIAPPVQVATSAIPATTELRLSEAKPRAKEGVNGKPLAPLAQPEPTRTAMASLRVEEPRQMPEAVRQQFTAGLAANAPLYQGPLVRYSIVRSGPAGDAIRLVVTTGIGGYLALYQVDADGNSMRVYPVTDLATPVLPGLALQIPSNPIKIGDPKGRLRLVVVPQTAVMAPSAGTIGGFVNGAVNSRPVNKDASPFPTPPAPLVVDIPLAPN